MAGNGEPEGIAQAPLTPNARPKLGPYSFTYEAKSKADIDGRVANAQVRPSALARHRRKHNADHTIVVAPDFELGALQVECEDNRVTPMRAGDLARLLMLSAKSGTVDFVEFREVFEFSDPDDVHAWVEDFVKRSVEKPHVSVGELLEAFEDIGITGPDEVETTVIAYNIRTRNGTLFPTERDIRKSVEGLGVFLPSIVRISNKKVYLSASPLDIRHALVEQLQRLSDSMLAEIDIAI